MKLLIIDDADAVRLRLADVLGEIDGLEVDSCAPRAGGIIQRIQEMRPDIVVIDIGMQDGALDLVRTIKSVSHPPVVIALSGSSSIQYRAACHSAGAEYFFDKDREQARMVEAITELQLELAC
ncbi:MAG: response regulator [Treponemataceae bacterium]